MKLLLLPGMDGTGELFTPFVAEVSSWASTQIVRYPTHVCLSVDELVNRIEVDSSVTVIAESFSTAVGIRFATRHPALVERLILVGAFVTPPAGTTFLRMFGTLPFQLSPPNWALRHWLVGRDPSNDLVAQLSRTLSGLSPEVLAQRLAIISRTDERASLKALSMPITTISARQDRLVSARDTAELRSHVPGGQHFDLEGPHLILQARATQAAELLRTSEDSAKTRDPR